MGACCTSSSGELAGSMVESGTVVLGRAELNAYVRLLVEDAGGAARGHVMR